MGAARESTAVIPGVALFSVSTPSTTTRSVTPAAAVAAVAAISVAAVGTSGRRAHGRVLGARGQRLDQRRLSLRVALSLRALRIDRRSHEGERQSHLCLERRLGLG